MAAAWVLLPALAASPPTAFEQCVINANCTASCGCYPNTASSTVHKTSSTVA